MPEVPHSAHPLARISSANIGPDLSDQSRTISWQMSFPRSNSRCSTLRSDDGNRTYINTTAGSFSETG